MAASTKATGLMGSNMDREYLHILTETFIMGIGLMESLMGKGFYFRLQSIISKLLGKLELKGMNFGQIVRNTLVNLCLEKSMEMESWSGKIRALILDHGKTERCQEKDFRPSLTERFTKEPTLIVNLTV
jgi:hypothetical protein